MKYKSIKFFGTLLFLLLSLCALAQQPMDEEAEKKQMEEAIASQLEEMEKVLGLEDWQVFYADSIMHHDYEAMRLELKSLNTSKVSNIEAYERVQDKWMETIYQAFHELFDEKQWAKYEKTGAGREKKARDKREARRKQ